MTDVPGPCPYVSGGDAYSERWTSEAFTLEKAEKLVATLEEQAGVLVENVSGLCPRCGHSFSSVTVVSSPVVKGPPTLPPDVWTPVLVLCGCTQPHEGRPANQMSGCGARYNVFAQRQTV
jgi:hypothetical protein